MTVQPTATATPETAGRDARGRFAPGSAGGPGNPFARTVAALRLAVLTAFTPEDLADVARAMLARAKNGDVAAAKFLFSYAIGTPAKPVNPDRLDTDEWQLFKRTAPMIREAQDLMHTPDPSVPLETIRLTRQTMADRLRSSVAEVTREAAAAADAVLAPKPQDRPSTNGRQGAGQPSANGRHGVLRPSETISVVDLDLLAALQAAEASAPDGEPGPPA